MGLLVKGALVLRDADAHPEICDLQVADGVVTRAAPSLPVGAGAEVFDAHGLLALPGLISAHTHTREVLSKGLFDGVPLETWLLAMTVSQGQRSPRHQYLSCALGCAELIRFGVTGVYEQFTHLPIMTPEVLEAVLGAYRESGLRVRLAPSVADIPYYQTVPGLKEALPPGLLQFLADCAGSATTLTDLEALARRLDRLQRSESSLIGFSLGPVIPERCSDRFLIRCRQLAEAHGLGLHLHLAETPFQWEQSRRAHARTTTERLAGLGLLSPRTAVAHAIWITARDIALLAETGTVVVHNPASNLKLGSGIAPVRELLVAGVNVALGIDGFSTSDNASLFVQMKLAAGLSRLRTPDYRRWLTAREVFRMATVGGGLALGLAPGLGEIAEGRPADITFLDLGSPALNPLRDAVCQVVFAESGLGVRATMVAGRLLMRDGKVATIDTQKLNKEAGDALGDLESLNESAKQRFWQEVEPCLYSFYTAEHTGFGRSFEQSSGGGG